MSQKPRGIAAKSKAGFCDCDREEGRAFLRVIHMRQDPKFKILMAHTSPTTSAPAVVPRAWLWNPSSLQSHPTRSGSTSRPIFPYQSTNLTPARTIISRINLHSRIAEGKLYRGSSSSTRVGSYNVSWERFRNCTVEGGSCERRIVS